LISMNEELSFLTSADFEGFLISLNLTESFVLF